MLERAREERMKEKRVMVTKRRLSDKSGDERGEMKRTRVEMGEKR